MPKANQLKDITSKFTKRYCPPKKRQVLARKMKTSTKRLVARQLMLIASRLLEAGKKERFNEYTSILKKKKFDQDEIDDILEKLNGLQPAKKERVALHWIMNDTLKLPKDTKKLDKAFEYLELYKKKAEDFDNPDDLIDFGEKRDVERIVVDDFDPDTCPEFSNKQNLGKGIVVYDVEDTWEGMMAVRAAMDTSWGYDGGKWCLATRNHGKMDRAWDYWNNYNAYQKRIAYKNGKLYMFSANSFNELAWWNKDDKRCSYLPGVFDRRGYELTGDDFNMANDPKIKDEDLMVLIEHKDWNIRREVARNPNTSIKILKMFVNDENKYVRGEIAQNRNASVELLKMLAEDEYFGVRYFVAKNHNTPVEVLEILANDENNFVRSGVIINPNTPVEVLKILTNDKDLNIRYDAIRQLNRRS